MSPGDIKKVIKCWEGYERFVICGSIALGLLQLIALKFTQLVWDQFDVFIRTKSRDIPSERTVKYVITNKSFPNEPKYEPTCYVSHYLDHKSGIFFQIK